MWSKTTLSVAEVQEALKKEEEDKRAVKAARS